MTLRECSIQILREIGMDEDELNRFIEDQDKNAEPDNLEAVNALTVESLGQKQDTFWAGMRISLPLVVEEWRRQQANQDSFNE